MKDQPSNTRQASREELVRTRSEDGFRLDGVLILPAAIDTRPIAMVWVHGLYSAFYHSPGVETGRALASLGYACVIGNTRGHDFGAALVGRDGIPVCAGGGWEKYVDSPRDIAGWIDFALEAGFQRVALVGHSLGARKAAYYQSERQDSRVNGVALVSPGMVFLDPQDEELDEVLERAKRMVEEGRGRELVGWPAVGCSISAATLVEGEGSFQKIFFTDDGTPTVVSQVRCPLLVVYGSEEKTREYIRAAFDTIRRNARSSERIDARVIEGADHIYSGCEAHLAGAIAEWSDGL